MAEDKNTYSTYAVKLDGEVKEELQALLEGFKSDTGANAGDFIKTLLEVYKTNKIVSKVSSADADIKELNTLTNRIYSIYSNLIERNNNSNDALQVEFTEQLSEKDNIINNLKSKIDSVQQDHEELQDIFNSTCDEKIELEQSNSQLKKLNDSLELNISKLQEELIGLNELKEVNKKLSIDFEEHKKLLAAQQADNVKLQDSIKDKDITINQLNKNIEDNKNEYVKIVDRLKKDHAKEIINITDKLNMDKDKAILELKQIHQQEHEKLQEKYNNKINEYQTKYEKLFDDFKELEKAKATHTPRKGTTQNK